MHSVCSPDATADAFRPPKTLPKDTQGPPKGPKGRPRQETVAQPLAKHTPGAPQRTPKKPPPKLGAATQAHPKVPSKIF